MMNVEELEQKGQEHLRNKDFKQAIECFQKALTQEEHPSIRNNLALAYFLSSDLHTSIETLNPNIKPETPPNPFAHSMATRILHQLGRDQEAYHQLNLAIKDFEDGTHAFLNTHRIPASWGEYTVAIMRAVGTLSEHRQVYELYRRWQNYHRHWESTYLAGVAAFNLKRYRQAASCWASLLKEGRIFLGIQRLAILADQGIIPPFTLNYDFVEEDHIISMAEEAIESKDSECFRKMADSSTVRLFYLSCILDEDAPMDSRRQFTEFLVRYGRDWGEQLGRTWLLSPTINQELKMSIIMALQKAGICQKGEQIDIYTDGELHTVTFQEFASSESIAEEIEQLYREAISLAECGKKMAALQILEKPFASGKIYPPAIFLLAQLYHEVGSMEKREQLLTILDSLVEETGDNNLQLNLVLLYLKIGDARKARQQLDKIDLNQIPITLKQQILARINELEINSLFNHNVTAYMDCMREEIEEKNLPLNVGLGRGLKNMPVEWINAACASYELEPARQRSDREKQLIQHLQHPENLEEIILGLEDKERELLLYLLNREGWSRLAPITRRFGSMSGDGFYWNEDGPYSCVGQLWSLGLVFVGRNTINNRRTKIVTIPFELRPLLADLLAKVELWLEND